MGLQRKQWPRITQLEIYFNLYSSGKGKKINKHSSFPYQLRFSIHWSDKLPYIDMLITSSVHFTHT